MKKLSEGEKYFFKKKIFISHFPFPLIAKNENYLLFPPFLIPQIGKPHGKTSMKIFFFLTFFSLPLLVIKKNYHLPFFPKFREKVLKNHAKRAQVSFFTNYVFSAVITRTHTHTLFYAPIMRKNRA